jgi:sugar/nucleoside kinase (ribokinase family)
MSYNLNSHYCENLTLCKVYVAFLIYFSFTIDYHPGGAAQNTLRIFQWLLGYPLYSVFFGAIGNDDEGKLLEKLVKNSGVETRYTSRSSYAFFTTYTNYRC